MLIIEDHMGVRMLIEEVVRQLGAEVTSAANGHEGLDRARASRPQLAIVDLKLPVMGGFETAQALRNLYPDLPVVICSALGEEEVGRPVEVELQLAWVVRKPFDVQRLRRIITEALSEGSPPKL